MMKSGLIIAGGELDLSSAKTFIGKRAAGTYDLVIAVDAGLLSAFRLGVHPDIVVGDFDTLGRGEFERYQADQSLSWEIHRPEKDESDSELAFMTALGRGCTSVDILGATGGRLDHEIANIHLLAQFLKRGVDASIYDGHNRIYLLDAERSGGKRFHRPELYGKYVSFLPLTEEVRGITLRGFKYPLTEKDISVFENPSLCVSNEVTEEYAEMKFRKGIVICVESRD